MITLPSQVVSKAEKLRIDIPSTTVPANSAIDIDISIGSPNWRSGLAVIYLLTAQRIPAVITFGNSADESSADAGELQSVALSLCSWTFPITRGYAYEWDGKLTKNDWYITGGNRARIENIVIVNGDTVRFTVRATHPVILAKFAARGRVLLWH